MRYRSGIGKALGSCNGLHLMHDYGSVSSSSSVSNSVQEYETCLIAPKNGTGSHVACPGVCNNCKVPSFLVFLAASVMLIPVLDYIEDKVKERIFGKKKAAKKISPRRRKA